MTIGAAYASDLSRVRITCSGAPSLADYAHIERSVDQITWFTVRGGDQVALTAGGCTLDDYEFVAGQANYYRARYVDAADPSVVALGTLSTANNANVTPGLPAGLVDGDVLVMMAAIRNTAGSVNTPAGWSLWVDGGNFRVFVRIYATGQTAPTVTFSGGVANADTAARIIGIRNSDYTIGNSGMQSNASAQDIAFPGLSVGELMPNLMLLLAWKQATSTGATLAGWTLQSRDTATAGDDETIQWWTQLTSSTASAGTITLTGGVAAVSKATQLRFTRRPYVSQETASVTPVLTNVWLKNIGKPFLNRILTVTGFSEIVQPSRSGSFAVVGRRDDVAVTEVRGGNRYTLTVKTETDAQAEDLKAVLALGDTVLLHLPHDYKRFPGGYYLIGDLTTRMPQSVRSPRRYHDLPLTAVAAPSSVIVGTTVVWNNIISSFATWNDLMAAEPTWFDVMDRIGTPSDVVVP